MDDGSGLTGAHAGLRDVMQQPDARMFGQRTRVPGRAVGNDGGHRGDEGKHITGQKTFEKFSRILRQRPFQHIRAGALGGGCLGEIGDGGFFADGKADDFHLCEITGINLRNAGTVSE